MKKKGEAGTEGRTEERRQLQGQGIMNHKSHVSIEGLTITQKEDKNFD